MQAYLAELVEQNWLQHGWGELMSFTAKLIRLEEKY